MPSGVPMRTTAAFSPEAIRQSIRGRAAIPADMLERALRKTAEKLDAKEVKFFAHQGMVGDKREVEAHQIQLKAAELILQMSDLLSRGQTKPSSNRVSLEIDPKTGVTRIIIGDVEEEPPMIIAPQPMIIEHVASAPATEEQEVANDVEPEMEEIHIKRGVLSPEVREALFGKGAI